MKRYAAAFLIFSFLAVVYTYPLVLRMGSATYGYAGDNLGSLHYFWWWKTAKLHGWDVRQSFLEESPFGVTIDREPGTLLFYVPVKILTLFLDEVWAYNLILLLSFPLAGLSLLALANFLFKDFRVSLLLGFIFAFSPYHLWKAYNHLDLALIWTLPLFLRALLASEVSLTASARCPRLLSALFLAATWAATILTNFYYGYFALLALGVWSGFKFLADLRRRDFLRLRRRFLTLFGAAIFTAAFVLPETLHVVVDSQRAKSSQSFRRQDSYQRPLLNLVSLSARPWDYLLPSIDQPWWGSAVAELYRRIEGDKSDFKMVSPPPHERTIYLGLVTLILASFSLILLLLSRSFRKGYAHLVVVAAATSFILFLVSLPPYVYLWGRLYRLPAFFLYQVFPMFRTYSRLGIVVLLFSLVVGGASLAYLSRRFGHHRWFKGLFLLIAATAFLDFLNFPPAKVIDLTTPPVYRFLAGKERPSTIVEYPKDFNVAESLFFQRVHGQGVLNFHAQSDYFNLWDAFEDYLHPRSARVLAALGVRYAVFHKQLIFPQENPVDDLWHKRAFKSLPYYQGGFPGLRLVGDFPEAVVFEVEKALNAAAVVVLSGESGETKTDVFPKGDWIWSGTWNDLYLINLIAGGGAKATVRFSELSANSPKETFCKGSPCRITLNGEKVRMDEDGKFVFTLKDRINELRFEKDDSAVINFGQIGVDLEEFNSRSLPQAEPDSLEFVPPGGKKAENVLQ